MKGVCPKCKKEFSASWSTALEYMIKTCDHCAFEDIKNNLKSNFNIDLLNEDGKVKCLQDILGELSLKFNELKNE